MHFLTLLRHPMGNQKKKYTIGIDVGGTKILACLLNKDFRVLTEAKMKTKPETQAKSFPCRNTTTKSSRIVGESAPSCLRDGSRSDIWTNLLAKIVWDSHTR